MKKIKKWISKNKLYFVHVLTCSFYFIMGIFLGALVISVIKLNDKDEKANNNEVNISNLSTTNLSTYQVNDIVNLASPDLTGKKYLENGVYRLRTENGVTLDYNVYSGVFTLNGLTIGYPSYLFNVPNQPMYLKMYEVGGSNSNSNNPRFSVVFPNQTNTDISFASAINGYYINRDVSNIDMWSNTNITYTDYQFKLQIEKGTTATPYQTPLGAIKQHEQFIYDNGYTQGRNDGYNLGEREGFDEGYDRGYIDGTNVNFEGAYNKGFDDGRVLGFDEGYDHGYDFGQEIGYELGLNDNPNNNFGSLITSILLGVGTVLGIELLPNITIGAIIAVPIVFGIIAFVLGRKKE